jgi:hypothetical protein
MFVYHSNRKNENLCCTSKKLGMSHFLDENKLLPFALV